MRPRIACAVFALALLGLVAAPAGAVGPGRTQPFTGTTSYTFVTDGCSFVHQAYDGTFPTRHHRSGAFHLEGCVTLGNLFAYTGTFTMQRNRGQLRGTVAGTIDAASTPCAPFDFVLTITGGTRHLKHATGIITVTGQWCGRNQVPATNDPIIGTITPSIVH